MANRSPEEHEEDKSGLLRNAAPPGESRSYAAAAATTAGEAAAAAPPQLNPKIQRLKTEIDDATGIMRDNMERIAERGERLETLQDKSDKLAFQSQAFKSQASKARRQMCFKNAKWTICLGVFILIIIGASVAGAIEGKKYMEVKQ